MRGQPLPLGLKTLLGLISGHFWASSGLTSKEFIRSQHDLLLEWKLDPQKISVGAQDGSVLGSKIDVFSNPAHVGNS